MNLSTKDIIYLGLLTAITMAATYTYNIFGFFHLGSAALFTIGAAFGGLYGGLTGAISSGLFDIIGGHTQYTIFSIIIKGIVGAGVGCLTVGFYPPYKHYKEVSLGRVFFATIIGSILTGLGYLAAWGFVTNSWTVAITKLPNTFITSGVGILVTLLIIRRIQKLAKEVLKK